MMKITSQAKAEIEAAFGTELTGAQIWTIVKMMKHARLRCRNNAALNNWLNSVFGTKYRFSQENKTRKNRYTGADETYQGLVIRDAATREKVGSVDATENDEE